MVHCGCFMSLFQVCYLKLSPKHPKTPFLDPKYHSLTHKGKKKSIFIEETRKCCASHHSEVAVIKVGFPYGHQGPQRQESVVLLPTFLPPPPTPLPHNAAIKHDFSRQSSMKIPMQRCIQSATPNFMLGIPWTRKR